MSYSPFVGPALLFLFVLSSLPTAYRLARSQTPPVGKGVFVAIALGALALAGVQAALNVWMNWLGDAIFTAAAIGFLLYTGKYVQWRKRRKQR